MYSLYLILLLSITFLAINLGTYRESLAPLIEKNVKKAQERENINVYLTNNQLNYDAIDGYIQVLERRYQLAKYDTDKMQFHIGQVSTTESVKDEPKMEVGGSFPSNILLNFSFPLPPPGMQGEKGERGEKGQSGTKGEKGKRGVQGGPVMCK